MAEDKAAKLAEKQNAAPRQEQVKLADATQENVQKAMNTETDRGLRGVEVDPTPNDAYTVAGVTSDAPTPESDPTAAAEAAKVTAMRSRFTDSPA